MKLQVAERTERIAVPWPGEIDVIVVPGISGQEERAYPSRTTDLVKRLRAAAIRVDYLEPDRYPEVKLMADEVWLPLLIFGRDVAALALAGLIVEIVKAQIGAGWRKARMHAQIGRITHGDDECTISLLDGDGEDVLGAIERIFPEQG